MSLSTLTFGTTVSTDFGVYAAGAGMYSKPKKIYEAYSVPGRNGVLVYDTGTYENIDIKYECVLPNTFKSNYDDFIAELAKYTGYQRLTDTVNPNRFRMGVFVGASKPKPTDDYDGGTFVLTFDCKPQRFLTSGESFRTYRAGNTITNPTGFNAYPILRVYGYGDVRLGGSSTNYVNYVTIAQSSDQYTDIDLETGEAYYGSYNRNNRVTFTGKPMLVPGSQTVGYRGNVTTLQIKPRWYEI